MHLVQAPELPFVREQPEVRRWYARILIDRNGTGDREKARQLLDEAVASYRQIGMPGHVEVSPSSQAIRLSATGQIALLTLPSVRYVGDC